MKSLLRDDRVLDTLVLIFSGCFVLFLLVFGWKYHPIPTFGVEIDRYVEKADLLTRGILPREDVLHPIFYPLLTAGLGMLLRDTFVAGRMISSVMAGVFVWATYLLGRRIFGRITALLGFLFMVTNFHVITHGVLTSADMTSSAFVTFALVCLVHLHDVRRPYRMAIAAGLMVALSYFTRYPTAFVLPTMLLGIFFGGRRPMKERWAILGVFALSVVVFLLPYGILSFLTFGSPMYNENWKNVAFKVYGDMDWTYFGRVPFDGLASVILHSPAAFLKAGLGELAGFLRAGLSGLLGLPPLMVALCFLGGYTTLFSMRKEKAIVLTFPIVYTLGISFAFFTWARGMLPILPLCSLLIADFLVRFDKPVRVKARTLRPLVLLALLLCGLKVVAMIPDVKLFIARHPIEEVDAAIALEQEHGRDITIMGTCLDYIVQRAVNCTYQELRISLLKIGKDEQQDLERYYQDLHRILREQQVDYLIIGRISMDRTIKAEQHVPHALLINQNPPPYLKPVRQTDNVMVYAVE